MSMNTSTIEINSELKQRLEKESSRLGIPATELMNVYVEGALNEIDYISRMKDEDMNNLGIKAKKFLKLLRKNDSMNDME